MRNLPSVNAKYWLSLGAASIFGTNTGDFVAGYLHVGHLAGLPYLALLFGAIVLAARFSEQSSVLYFWAAIITVRTAATNVGDTFHDFHVPYSACLPFVLALFAASVLLYKRVAGNSAKDGTMRVDAAYWLAMMLAGILGTIGGDFASFRLGLTPAGAALAVGIFVPVSIVWFARKGSLLDPVPYWTTVALIRTAGTAAGDALAQALRLSVSTVVTGLIFAGLVLYFYGFQSTHRVRPATAAAARIRRGSPHSTRRRLPRAQRDPAP